MAQVDLKAVDPAVVATQEKHMPKQAPVFPVRSSVVQKAEDSTFPKVNFTTHTVVATEDEQFVAIPRETVAKLAGVSVAAEERGVGVFENTAAVLIAVAHWTEQAATAAPTEIPRPVPYTDLTMVVKQDWEKDFWTRLANAGGGETLFRLVKFAEKHALKALQSYCVVGISCSLRGKSNHEMAMALGCDVEEFSAEEIEEGKKAYAFVAERARK